MRSAGSARAHAPGVVALRAESAPYVRVEPAAEAESSARRGLAARVTFDERHVSRLGTPVQGRVTSVAAITGDRVAAGQVLVTIHSADVVAARTQVAQARTARLLAEQTAQRAERLVREGAGSEAERVAAQAALAQAREEEQRTRAALAVLGGSRGLSDYVLRAPIAGTVVERNVAIGNEVNADQDAPLLTIADLSTVWVLADVYESDLPLIDQGDEAVVNVAAAPGRRFVGRVTHVGEVVDPATRTTTARIELANPDQVLRPGMFAHVEVEGRGGGTAQVPTSAVLARRDEFFVFVREADRTFRRRLVRLGEQRGNRVAVLEGLHPGDPVVTEGAILLDAEANEAL